jgi:hypothetical protein
MKNLSNLALVSLLALVRCGGSEASSPTRDASDGSSSSWSSNAGSTSTQPGSSWSSSTDSTSAQPGSSSTHAGSSSSSNVLDGGGPDAACWSHPASDAAVRAAPPNHRAAATACAPAHSVCLPDGGGGQACSSDADCAAPDGSFSFFTHCLRGQCAADGCLADSDCASDHVCACSSQFYGGNACFHPNLCVPANCHVDADCGPGGFCSPSLGYCGAFVAYYCQRPTDPCVDPTVDCSCPSGFFLPACVYSPASAAWVCGQGSVCAG